MLPLVVGLMLVPLAVAPPPPSMPPGDDTLYLSGELPAEVATLPDVVRDARPSRIRFYPPSLPDEPGWRVEGDTLPDRLTEALNAMDRKIRVVTIKEQEIVLPNRSLLLSLVSASTLTGALAQSIPGERASRTLETLRTASVSAAEIVVGKWLAWTFFSGGMATLAGVVAVLLGNQTPGPWLLALPWVAAGTAAGGLWLVRRANDVVGGATVALRTQPAALAAVALAAWGLGRVHPWLGASVPLGGALMAAGSLWEGWAPVLIAITSTGLASAWLLHATARDLGEHDQNHLNRDWGAALAVGSVAAVSWWVAVLGSMVWALGGAVERTEMIPLSSGPTGGMLALACIVVATAARHPTPLASLGLVRARAPSAWGLAAVAGVVLFLVGSTSALWPMPAAAAWADARARLIGASTPSFASPFLLVSAIAAQELLFRGWIRRAGGGVIAALVSAAVLAPLDPLRGLLEALVLGALVVASGGAVLPAIVARLLAAVGAMTLPAMSPWVGVVAAVVFAGGLLWRERARAP